MKGNSHYCPGEMLADVANMLSSSRIDVVDSTGSRENDELAFARIKTALELRKKPSILLKSIVEDWDMYRIVKELY